MKQPSVSHIWAGFPTASQHQITSGQFVPNPKAWTSLGHCLKFIFKNPCPDEGYEKAGVTWEQVICCCLFLPTGSGLWSESGHFWDLTCTRNKWGVFHDRRDYFTFLKLYRSKLCLKTFAIKSFNLSCLDFHQYHILMFTLNVCSILCISQLCLIETMHNTHWM